MDRTRRRPEPRSYDNPEYDKLYEQIRFMPNGPERFALFARMNEIIRRDLPVIFTFNVSRVGLHPALGQELQAQHHDRQCRSCTSTSTSAVKAKKGPH